MRKTTFIVLGLLLLIGLGWFLLAPERESIVDVDDEQKSVGADIATPYPKRCLTEEFGSVNPEVFIEINTPGVFVAESLGLAFDYPNDWDIFEECFDPPSEIYGTTFDGWNYIFENGKMSRNEQPFNFQISAHNNKSAAWRYEGAPGLLQYYGQSLDDICDTTPFLNPSSDYDVTVLSCEQKISDHGLEYVEFEAIGTALFEYGYNDLSPRLRSVFAETAHAQQFGDEFFEYGLIFPTKSSEWPGIAIHASYYIGSEPDIEFEYYEEEVEARNELINKYEEAKDEIQEIADSLRYVVE